jgi:hypothetical protein
VAPGEPAHAGSGPPRIRGIQPISATTTRKAQIAIPPPPAQAQELPGRDREGRGRRGGDPHRGRVDPGNPPGRAGEVALDDDWEEDIRDRDRAADQHGPKDKHNVAVERSKEQADGKDEQCHAD